jgi:PKHD-type hydroxylase
MTTTHHVSGSVTPEMFNEYLTTVGQFPKVLSPEECTGLIGLQLTTTDALVDARDPGNPLRNETGQLDYGRRRTKIKPIPPEPQHAWIFQRLRRLAEQANEQAFHFRLSDDMSLDVLEYGPQGFFDWHVDIGGGVYSTRKLTLVTALTPPDAYEGGDLHFADGGAPVRLAQGTTAIFPSYLLHKVEPVTKGMRHTLVAWIHGPAFT